MPLDANLGLPVLHITPLMMHRAYEYLRITPPFSRWRLPHADEVEFHVNRSKTVGSDCLLMHDGRHVIRVSLNAVGRTDSLMAYMAHEMVHLYLDRKGVRAHHGKDFVRCASQVCRHHGFDPKLF